MRSGKDPVGHVKIPMQRKTYPTQGTPASRPGMDMQRPYTRL
jgi:hypothetical protein